MGLLSSLLVNAVIAATPATPLPWYSFDDYPLKAFERERQGTTTISVIVDPTGRPAACNVTSSSGFPDLDKQTCWVVMKRVRFMPASGPDGQHTFGVYRSQVVWSRPDRDFVQHEPGPDLEVTVAALPAGTAQPPAVKIAYFVDSNGTPSSCTVLPESAKQPKPLIDAACSQFLAQAGRAPVNANGATVAAVKTAAVKFATN